MNIQDADKKIKDFVQELKKEKKSVRQVDVDNHEQFNASQKTSSNISEEASLEWIELQPEEAIEPFMHFHSSKYWIIVQGTAKVRLEDKKHYLCEEQSIFIPKTKIHEVSNPGKVPLKIIQIRIGCYLGEDDQQYCG